MTKKQAVNRFHGPDEPCVYRSPNFQIVVAPLFTSGGGKSVNIQLQIDYFKGMADEQRRSIDHALKLSRVSRADVKIISGDLGVTPDDQWPALVAVNGSLSISKEVRKSLMPKLRKVYGRLSPASAPLPSLRQVAGTALLSEHPNLPSLFYADSISVSAYGLQSTIPVLAGLGLETQLHLSDIDRLPSLQYARDLRDGINALDFRSANRRILTGLATNEVYELSKIFDAKRRAIEKAGLSNMADEPTYENLGL